KVEEPVKTLTENVMRVNDSGRHRPDRNTLAHGLPAHEMIRGFLVEIALFHENVFGALDAAEGAQRLVEFVDSPPQPLLVKELCARDGEAGQHRPGGEWPVQHCVRGTIAQKLER